MYLVFVTLWAIDNTIGMDGQPNKELILFVSDRQIKIKKII